MAVTAWKPAGAGANDDAVGAVAWSDPGNITASNDARATSALSSSNTTTQILRATTFGFTIDDIPIGSTIDGIEVGIEKQQPVTGGNNSRDLFLSLRLATGVTGDDKAVTNVNWGNSDAESVYGTATDAWNAGLTPANIHTDGFERVAECGSRSYSNPRSLYAPVAEL
jgi:hypothetical protein